MSEQLGGPLGELLASMIPKLAARQHQRFPGVPREDLEQEMWLRALTISLKLRKLLDEGKEGIIWTELKRAAVAAGKADERWHRNERAVASGYSTDDEQFYTLGVLRALLPLYFAHGVTDEPVVQRDNRQGASSSDGSATGEYLAMMVDIDIALKAVTPYQRKTLKRWFACSQEENEDGRWERQQLASSMGMTVDAFRMRVNRCLSALQAELGGSSPWPRTGR